MSHKHEHTLAKIFAHPMDMNIHLRDVTHMLEGLGGTVDHTKHGQLKVTLNGKEQTFGIPHHGSVISSRDEVMRLRHFLTDTGFAPAKT
jgi:hypothetical protein